jgi:purine-nucleoside phosphorylase
MNPTFAYLESLCREEPPEVVLVLGSGLGVIADRIDRLATVPFRDIPGLPAASVHGHRGALSLGTWAGRRLLLYEGRLHYYEGHPWDVVTRPIRLAADLGVRWAVLTNAAGGIRDDLGPGSLMLLTDHLEWNRPHSYRQPPRPSPYSERLRDRFRAAARSCGQVLPEGVYAAMTGPCYETPAEIRALRSSGADAVGMSTAREAQAGAERGLEIAAVSLITNKGAGLASGTLNHDEVMVTARATAERLAALLEAVLRR